MFFKLSLLVSWFINVCVIYLFFLINIPSIASLPQIFLFFLIKAAKIVFRIISDVIRTAQTIIDIIFGLL